MDTNKSRNNKSALGNLLANSKTPNLVPPVLHEVGKLAAGVASVSTVSTASATGNPRNKCALQPGHSLMDWIRLGNSGKDLTGVGQQAGRLSITSKELGQHDKVDDCWLAIRGVVYNVTAYLNFHPGGVDELMKGAGKDATSLFDQVHPWVNYQSILQKCLVGRLVALDPSVDKEDLFFGKPQSPGRIANSMASPEKAKEVAEISVQTTEYDLSLPRFDWIQKMTSITFMFYTGAFSNPAVEIAPVSLDNELSVALIYGSTRFTNELQLQHPVKFPCKTKIYCETGKVELVFAKETSQIWDTYGVLRQKSKQIIQGGAKVDYTVADKQQITHDIVLIRLHRMDKVRQIVPIGKHVRVFHDDSSRSYTPVPDSLFTQFGPKAETTDSVCLMVKSYRDGLISPWVSGLKKGDSLMVSSSLGPFELHKLEKLDKFLLLAAGTGITPMFGLIVFLLERRIKKCQSIRLLFFNKTPEDIPFHEQLEELSRNDKRFHVEHILSEPTSTWQGTSGRISANLVKSTIQEDLQDTIYTLKDIYACACGPSGFVQASETILEELGLDQEHRHSFQG